MVCTLWLHSPGPRGLPHSRREALLWDRGPPSSSLRQPLLPLVDDKGRASLGEAEPWTNIGCLAWAIGGLFLTALHCPPLLPRTRSPVECLYDRCRWPPILTFTSALEPLPVPCPLPADPTQQDTGEPEVSPSVLPSPYLLPDSSLLLLGVWHQCDGDSGQVL